MDTSTTFTEKEIIMTKITFAAVKSVVEANATITDRGDLVRATAAALSTNYGNVYLKVVKAEKELGLVTTSRKGRKPGTKKAAKIAEPVTFNVVRVKDGSLVAEGVTSDVAAMMIEKARKAKKGALRLA